VPNDPELTDDVLGSEIELLADVIDVAGGSDASLSQEQIDDALGLGDGEVQADPPSADPRSSQ
jgi:hypothetical protein